MSRGKKSLWIIPKKKLEEIFRFRQKFLVSLFRREGGGRIVDCICEVKKTLWFCYRRPVMESRVRTHEFFRGKTRHLDHFCGFISLCGAEEDEPTTHETVIWRSPDPLHYRTVCCGHAVCPGWLFDFYSKATDMKLELGAIKLWYGNFSPVEHRHFSSYTVRTKKRPWFNKKNTTVLHTVRQPISR